MNNPIAALNGLNAVLVSPEQGQGMYQILEGIANKVGMDTPNLHVLKPRVKDFGEFGNVMIDSLVNKPNAAAVSAGDVVISQPMLDMFGTKLSEMPPKALEAIMAHECNHCANYDMQKLAIKAPLFVLPAVAVMGVYLYDRAKANAAEKHGDNPTSQQTSQALNEEVATVTDELEQQNIMPTDNGEKFKKGLITTAKYTAAAGLGLATGMLVSLAVSRHIEFGADAFAAETVGKQHIADGLAAVHGKAQVAIEGHEQNGSFSKILEDLLSTHPSFERRINNIASLSL